MVTRPLDRKIRLLNPVTGQPVDPIAVLFLLLSLSPSPSRDFSIENEKKAKKVRRAITVWQGLARGRGRERGREREREGGGEKGEAKGRKRGLGACALTQQYGEFCEAAQYPPDHQLINILPHTRHVIRAAHACHASCEPLRV